MNNRSVGDPNTLTESEPASARLIRRSSAVLYPNAYVWLVFFSAMDIMLTWKILELHGSEINPIAEKVIEAWQLPGAIVFKFTLMFFVIVVCEIVGRQRDSLGRWLARLAVVVCSTPVAYSLGLLTYHYAVVYGWGGAQG